MKALFVIGAIVFGSTYFYPTREKMLPSDELQVLVGEWQLDMSPQNTNDDNFAMMEIKSINEKTFKGTFYRKGVKIREGRINTQTGVIYAALVSGDNSGEYNTSFYYQDGKLYGSTHSLDRDFLAVWVATKKQD
jgi:hypothetical protein